MKIIRYILFLIVLFSSHFLHAQISKELQDAINNVPIAKFDYPSNRNRNTPPEVASPQVFAFAYYRLPYAINLNPDYNDAVGGYVEKVMIDFDSVDLSPATERKIIQNALIQLQELIDRQVRIARIAGFIDYTNYSRSYISQFSTNGNAIIAIRELMSSQALLNKLVNRAKYF